MALPSSRRPPTVEAELVEETKKKLLKVKVNRVSIFMDMMVSWYERMPEKMRKKLTAKKVKGHAVNILHSLNYVYDNLPNDWVQQLMERCGLKMYVRTKTPEDLSFLGDREVSVKVDPLSLLPGMSLECLNVSQASTSRAGGSKVCPEESKVTSTVTSSEDSVDTVKKMVDLTNEPPPAKWLKAYSEGVHLRRTLTIYSGEDMNIMYYEYDAKFEEKDDIDSTQPQVHTANDFKLFAETDMFNELDHLGLRERLRRAKRTIQNLGDGDDFEDTEDTEDTEVTDTDSDGSDLFIKLN